MQTASPTGPGLMPAPGALRVGLWPILLASAYPGGVMITAIKQVNESLK